MQPGKRDTQITFTRATQVRDDFGGFTETWADYRTVWASVSGLNGREFWAAQQANAERVLIFNVRWTDAADILMTDRIDHDSASYDILDIKMIGRRQEAEIRAKARVDQ